MLSRIRIKDFGIIDFADIYFNKVTLFVGDNGSGKSTILEAISWCLFGKFLRGMKKYFDSVTSSTCVEIWLDDLYLKRSKSKFHINKSNKELKSENNFLIKDTYGSHSLFLKTRFLCKTNILKFSVASDTDKRKVLDDILDLDTIKNHFLIIKEYLKDCLSELSTLEDKLKSLNDEVVNLEDVLLGFCDAFFAEDKDFECSFDLLKNKYLEEKDIISEIKIDINDFNNKINSCEYSLKSIKRDKKKYAKEIQSLIQDVCPMCGHKGDHSEVVSEYEKRIEKLELKLKDTSTRLDSYLYEIAEKEKFLDKKKKKFLKISGKYHDFDSKASLYYRNKKLAKNIRERKSFVLNKLDSKRRDICDVNDCIYTLKKRIKKVQCLKNIFSNKGFVEYAVIDYFNNISALSSAILREISGVEGSKIKLIHDSSGSISLDVKLNSKFYPYRGLSEGEKTIVDFSILRSFSLLVDKKIKSLPMAYDDIFDSVHRNRVESIINYIKNNTEQSIVCFHDFNITSFFNDSGSTYYTLKNGEIK